MTRYSLALLPLLQILLIYFGFVGEAPRLFVFLATSTAIGALTFHLIRKLKNHNRREWFSFLYSSAVVAALLTIPAGFWFFLYTGGNSLLAVALPFLLVLPLCMSFYELYYIFRDTKSVRDENCAS